MDFKEIKLIDFSNGIKSEEVMENDIALLNNIERERVAVAGYGISQGLELNMNNFECNISTGSIVDKDGIEKIINGRTINIEKPTIRTNQELLFLGDNGAVRLSEVPYADSRMEISEETSRDMWGITAVYEDSPNQELDITAINNNYIYINKCEKNRAIIVTYNIAFDRIDTIYIDDNYNISIVQGVDSTTPTAYKVNKYKYILGFIKIISKYCDDKTGKKYGKASIIRELSNRRTVYTDSNNNLFLCGIPFESLLRIYFEEPKNPKEGMLWYDMTTNLLKIYRRTDNFMFTDIITYEDVNTNIKQRIKTSVGYYQSQLNVYIQNRNINGNLVWNKLKESEIKFYSDLKESEYNNKESMEFEIVPKMVKGTVIRYSINRYDNSYYWVPINATSYINTMEFKMWAPNNDASMFVNYMPGLNLSEMKLDRKDHDLKTFIFNKEELNLRFTPHKNEISLMIDQIPLHRDQFVEITAKDMLEDKNLLEIGVKYGYTSEYLNNLLLEYQDIGIGFKLANKLDRIGFVEANVTHRVNDSILKNKLQRSATFKKSVDIKITAEMINSNYLTIKTPIPYKVNEEQIEVYKNGLLLNKSCIKEVNESNILGEISNEFQMIIDKADIKIGDIITYKITTNVYTYDHVTNILDQYTEELKTQIADLSNTLNKVYNKVKEMSGGNF